MRRTRTYAGTFSIVACDLEAGEWGGAVASKFLAAGALVLYARAGVGAVATQSFVNTSYGPRGLDLMAAGASAHDALRILTEGDDQRYLRQAGMVDSQGRSATFTGERCFPWAGGITGDGFACQGNILVGEEVVQAMAEAFRSTAGPLSRRLLAALRAGDLAGGDRRGRQSAALLVMRAGGGYGGMSDRYIDLRIDDHPDPVAELARLLDLHELYFLPPEPDDILPADAELTRQIQDGLRHLGYWQGPSDGVWSPDLEKAFFEYAGTENLEERIHPGPQVDRKVIEYMRAHLRRLGARRDANPVA
ncbi:MAG: DUF1028 domain-containing protein [Bacillota bacterium]